MSRKMNRSFFLLAAVLVASIALTGWARAGQVTPGKIEVRVVPQAEVSGESFTLGEIAEMDGFDPVVLRKLAGIEIGRSPLPGKTAPVSESWLRSKLRGWRGPALRLVVPPGARVVRTAQRIPGDEIERMVMKYAGKEIDVPEGGQLRQQVLGGVRDVVLPKGQVHWEITPVGTHLVQGGDRKYRIVARVLGARVWDGFVRVRQQVFSEVLVAARPIRRGQMLAKGDFSRQRKNLSNNRGDPYLTRIEDVEGRQAVRPIGKGEALRQGLLARPANVAEGGKVTMIYKKGALVLRTLGVAMVKGKTGQFIPVRNLQTGKIVHGIVQGDETVRVD